MPRQMLNDQLWSKLKNIMQQFRIYNKFGLRKMVEGMLYRIRVGCPWRDLPPEFGKLEYYIQKILTMGAKP